MTVWAVRIEQNTSRGALSKSLRFCNDQAVDVLVIAGDVFSEQATASQVAESFRHLRETFRPFFQRGGTILAITGNHDQDGRILPFIELARAGMDIAEPPQCLGDLIVPGRMYLFDNCFFGRLCDSAGMEVQFVLLPYPQHSRMLISSKRGATAEQTNRDISHRITRWLNGLPANSKFNGGLRTVLVGHIHVIGSEFARGRFADRNEVTADVSDLPTGWDYLALGHIHKPQRVGGLSHVRYPGSLDRLDFGEQDDRKGVVLIDIGPGGLNGSPRFIEIEATTLMEVRVASAAITVDQLAGQVPNLAYSLVRVIVEPEAAAANSGNIDRTIRQALPCVTNVSWQMPENEGRRGARTAEIKATTRETVCDYLRKRLPDDYPQREALIKLAEGFLDE